MDPETIGFKAVPDKDPAFYLNAHPDPRSQTNAGPDSGQTLPSLTDFYMKNILFLGNRS
jgi:hypothetical protein